MEELKIEQPVREEAVPTPPPGSTASGLSARFRWLGQGGRLLAYMMERGWRQIHQANGALVTDGIYARVRHPQYVGLFMLIGSLLIQWPTFLSLLMAPLLIVAYVRLARREERELEAQFGQAYRDYRARVSAFWPRLSLKRHPPEMQSQDGVATREVRNASQT